uniref:Protein lsm12 log a-like isoform x2 n=1 Tax=Tabanus bromius TaxID=304241 RepID=A0A0K8TRH7_TABBR
MAAVGDCFSIGSTVACQTCFDETVEGEVLAFDHQTKMLILKCPSKNSEKLNDFYILNLQFCSDVQVKKEVSAITETPQPLNINRLKTKVRNTVEQRQRWVSALAADVSPEGQKLYMAVSKTISHVAWSGQNIVILDEVTISPPYKVDNVTTGNPEKTSLLSYVKKMVEQFTKSQSTHGTAGSSSNSKSVGNSNASNASPVPAN